MNESTEKALHETMLKAVSYLNLDKVKGTEEELRKTYPLMSEHFYYNFEKTISNKNEVRDFIYNLNIDESTYDKMAILDRLRFGLNKDKDDEISFIFALSEWIALYAKDTQLRRSANWDLMHFSLLLGKNELAIKFAEKFMSLETDVKRLMIGCKAILDSCYKLMLS